VKKKFLSILNLFFLLFYAHTEEQQSNLHTTSTAFFITDSGIAVASYHAVADATEISTVWGTWDGPPMFFEIIRKDIINDIVILKPKGTVQSKPVSLLMGDVDLASSIANVSFNPQNQLVSSLGIVKFGTGIAGDIRHIELEFSREYSPKEGPVFNNKGLCIGFISNHATDIFALLYEPKGAGVISLMTKVDYLYPLVKNVPGVLWTKDENTVSEAKQFIDTNPEALKSIIHLDITKPNAGLNTGAGDAPSTVNHTLAEMRKQIPERVLFISVSVASGISNINFANKLLDQLNKQKIGQPISPTVKQKYYQAIYARFGSSLTADQLVKTAADFSNGYYLEAECTVGKEVEDSVRLTLYQSQTMDILAHVRSAKVIQSNHEEAVMQLTEMTVKELAKQLKSKKLPVFAN